MKIARLIIAVATFGVSTIAWAADDWRIGIALGANDYESTVTEEEFALVAPDSFDPPLGNVVFSSSHLKNGDAAWKLFFDYDLGNYLAVDLGYLSLGDLQRFEADYFVDDGINRFDAYTTHKVNVDGAYTAAVGRLPIWNTIELTARAGIYRWDRETSSVTTVDTVSDKDSDSESGSDGFYGMGINTSLFGIQYEVYDIDGEDVGFIGITLRNDLE
jgi:hypothetical protein